MQPLPLHHLHLPGTFGTLLRYFANVAITAQCPFGYFPTRVGIFTAILGCAVLRLEKRCFAFAAADFGCLQLGLVGTFAAGILVLTVGPPTNLTMGNIWVIYGYYMVNIWLLSWLMMVIWWCNVPILKNDGVNVNGKDDKPYMKWNIKVMFETTNQ